MYISLFAAGENMTQHYQTKGTADENIDSLDISTKSHDTDFATAIDVENENFIMSSIKMQFPGHEVRFFSLCSFSLLCLFGHHLCSRMIFISSFSSKHLFRPIFMLLLVFSHDFLTSDNWRRNNRNWIGPSTYHFAHMDLGPY